MALTKIPKLDGMKTYVPSITATTTAPTKGTTVHDIARYTIDEDNMMEWEYDYLEANDGSGANGTGNYKIAIPTGFTIDTSLYPVQTVGSIERWVGQGVIGDNTNFGNSNQHAYIFIISSTELGVAVRDGTATANAIWGAGTPVNTTFAADQLRFSLKARFKVIKV